VTKNFDDTTNELLEGFEAMKSKNCRLKGIVSTNDSGLQDLQNAVTSLKLLPSKDTQNSKSASRSRDWSEDNVSSDKQDHSISRECDVVDDNSQMERENMDRTVETKKAFEYTEEAIEKMVVDFVNAETESILIFDSSLVNRERFWVHRLAEKYGLAHWSGGEGKDRRITIKKRTKKQNCTNDVGDAKLLEEDSNTCLDCSKAIPKHNLELHSLHCTRSKGERKEIGLPKKDIKKKVPAKAGNKEKKKTDEDDVDALIAQFTKVDSICSFEKCKGSVLTLGQKCKFCVRMFCLKHGLAEVHGCGEAAKVDARKAFEKSAGKAKTRPLNDIQKKYVKKKLNEKIVEMEKKRTGNTAKKK